MERLIIFTDENKISSTVGPGVASGSKPVVLYAGNIGEGQGLHRIIPELARKKPDVEFLIIGDGGKATELSSASAGIINVKILPPVSRDDLLGYYAKATILFIHLNSHAAFEKVLPSKLFEYAALGKPILAGVSGFAAQFLREELDASAIFAPCSVSEGLRALDVLLLETLVDNSTFIAKYDRTEIMKEMAASIIKVFGQCESR